METQGLVVSAAKNTLNLMIVSNRQFDWLYVIMYVTTDRTIYKTGKCPIPVALTGWDRKQQIIKARGNKQRLCGVLN